MVERSAKNVCIEENTESRMDPESGQLESSLAGTGQLESQSAGSVLKHPDSGVSRTGRSNKPSTADGCLPVGVSSNLWKTFFSLEEHVIRTQTDSHLIENCL